MSTVKAVQATISAFDNDSRSGRVLLDDGLELPFGPDAFADGQMLHARLGQRVQLHLEGGTSSRVTSLRLITF